MHSRAFGLFRQRTFVHRVLWFMLTLSMVIYAGVLWQVESQHPDPRANATPLRAVLTASAAACALVSVGSRSFALSDDRLRKFLEGGPDPRAFATGVTGRTDAAGGDESEQLDAFEQRLLGLPGWYFTPYIVSLVLNESVAIHGFILGFQAGALEPMLPFLVAGLVLNVWAYPRFGALVERADGLRSTLGP